MATVIRSRPLASRLDRRLPGQHGFNRCAAWRCCCPTARRSRFFVLADNSIRAVGNIDPIGRAAVLSRGIVGDRGGVPVIQSPLKKQAFSLLDGRCLDAEGVSIPVYATRVGVDGTVWVANSPDIRFGYRRAGLSA